MSWTGQLGSNKLESGSKPHGDRGAGLRRRRTWHRGFRRRRCWTYLHLHPVLRAGIGSVLVRIEFVGTGHHHGEWLEGMKYANGSVVVGQHVVEPLVAVR